MGLLDWLFGRRRAPREPAEPKEGPPKPSFVPESYPFEGEIRLRHPDYDRLKTGWWQVTIDSPEAWEAKVEEMRVAFQRHFGIFVTEEGETLPRWNDRTWARVRRQLVVGRRQ